MRIFVFLLILTLTSNLKSQTDPIKSAGLYLGDIHKHLDSGGLSSIATNCIPVEIGSGKIPITFYLAIGNDTNIHFGDEGCSATASVDVWYDKLVDPAPAYTETFELGPFHINDFSPRDVEWFQQSSSFAFGQKEFDEDCLDEIFVMTFEYEFNIDPEFCNRSEGENEGFRLEFSFNLNGCFDEPSNEEHHACIQDSGLTEYYRQNTFCCVDFIHASQDFETISNESNSLIAQNAKLKPNENVNVYPNPANNIVRLEDIDIFSKVEVFNTFGQLMFRGSNDHQKSLNIPVEDFSEGVYFIRIEKEEEVLLLNFLKN